MEGGGATLYAVTNMELRNTPSERKVRHSIRGCSEVERKRFAAEAEAKEYDGSDTDAKTLPKSRIVLYHDLLPRLWGWDRLVPLDIIYVPWTEYINYLQVYYSYNAKLLPATAAAAETCLSKEKNLAAAWKIWRSDMDIIALSKSIILNCLIHECAQSVIWTAGCRFSDACSAADEQ
ncbi:hypothetical protein PVAP13_6NG113750 [Panicum virgatum]|uniref:Uncharacterized protein n=1 Tax=Panicum virgatum TaxID=38727 RepID=A0A8T0QV22_PANVG|nr:hypothetical protein PVAP13_6NG113750 [Panicum virgatum]